MKELKKKDIENLSYKDIAHLVLMHEEKGVNTLDLFTKIINLLELPSSTIDNSIGDFYTSLTTDKRFLMVDGLWDLRTRHTSDKILVNTDDEEDEEEIYDEMDDEMENEEDDYEEIDNETDYDDTDDDGLSSLVVLDEDELESDN